MDSLLPTFISWFIDTHAVWFQALVIIIMAAKAICSLTATPDPSTPMGKVYKVVEWLALIFGKMKDKGVRNG